MTRLIFFVALWIVVLVFGVSLAQNNMALTTVHFSEYALELPLAAWLMVAFSLGLLIAALAMMIFVVWPMQHRIYLLDDQVEVRQSELSAQREWMERRFSQP